MHADLLAILRCPFCGTHLEVVDNDALVREGEAVLEGVLGCQCCAYPVVAGIPVLIADDPTRRAMHALEAGRAEEALFGLMGRAGDAARQDRLRALMRRPDATYREALDLLCDDAEGLCFFYRFTDPTFVTIEVLLRSLAQAGWPVQGRALDLCGGSGHVTRVLSSLRPAGRTPQPGTVLADVGFWKLWLARRFTTPGVAAVCCDANSPLPFAPGTFSLVLLADAFPYIWHKRMLADEMMRLAGREGLVVMPHLHSSEGENHSAGDTLTPAAYRHLFAHHAPRLFSDARLFEDVVERSAVDLTADLTPDELTGESSFTLVSTPRSDVFREYRVEPEETIAGELTVNPLYRVDRRNGASVLTLAFPSPEYEAEFGECRRYLPEEVRVEAELTHPIDPARLGSAYAELRARRVLIDAPIGYGARTA